ncbi:MAG: LysR substrate-binding domain-containing protein [Cyclobacteriaceae bacterium]
MSYQLELRHFKYFKAVAEELNFRNAAKRLFISQPGLSRQIRQMEEILNSKLFERTKRKVSLTASGTFLLTEVNAILNRLDSASRQLELIEKGESGELRIGLLGSAMQKVVPEFLLKLTSQFPNVHASVDEMSNGAQIDGVSRGTLDIGFVRVAYVPEPLNIRPVIDDTFSLVLPEGHWLTQSNFENIKQLADEDFILFSSDYSPLYYDKIMSIFEDQNFVPKISHKSVHALTIFKLVECGLGIAIIPTTLQDGFDLKIKFIEMKNIIQQTTLSAIWSEDNRNPILRNAIELIFS